MNFAFINFPNILDGKSIIDVHLTGETRIVKMMEHEHKTDKCGRKLESKQWARSNWTIRKQNIMSGVLAFEPQVEF